jgi:hypothetical protein
MMKYTFTILIAALLQVPTLAQDFLSFPKNTKFFDISGNSFMTVRAVDQVIYLAEHSGDGNIIWSENISFPMTNPLDTVIVINDFQRFGTTNDYLLSVFSRQLDQGNSIFDAPSNHLSIKISLDQQTIDTTSHFIPSGYIRFASKNDSTISFFSYQDIDSSLRGFETWEINTGLDTTFIAPLDSMLEGDLYSHFRHHNGFIYHYNIFPSALTLNLYQENISFVSNSNQDISIFPFGQSTVELEASPDKIVAFSQINDPSSPLQWRMFLMNKELELLDHSFFTPISTITGGQTITYIMPQDGAVITSEFIYVLAHPHNSSDEMLSIFVYDSEFNEVCRIPLNSEYSGTESLFQINGKAYFKKAVNDSDYDYYLIDGCEFNYLNVDDVQTAGMLVYPNPSSTIFNIQNSKNIPLQIRALNMQGQEILSFKSSNSIIAINLENHPTGIYFLEITSGDRRLTQKIIKQ